MPYWIVREKGGGRWIAYDYPEGERPEVKSGYEMRGPFKNLVQAMMAANPIDAPVPKPSPSPPR